MPDTVDIAKAEQATTPGGVRFEAMRTGLWLVLAVIVMVFAALTSAIVVSQGSASDWQHVPLPPVIYWSTVLLLGCSVSVDVVRRRARRQPRGGRAWLVGALFFTAGFLCALALSIARLRAQGFALSSNLSVSYLYVLLAAQAICALGGLFALAIVGLRSFRPGMPLEPESMTVVSSYWHFMLALWLYLLLLFGMLL